MKALIIDDEIDICFLLTAILKNADIESTYVNTLEAARNILDNQFPEIIFLDNHLPDGVGVDFISYIKKNKPDSKIVMITAYDTQKDRLELNQIKLQKKYSTDICNIHADAAKVKIAFVNLMVNAIEAMEPGKGVLQIATRGADGKCVVELKDNGSGMTEDQLNRLFEPYFTTKSNGNGLGLTNTQNIILNHDGSIYVSSSPGKGTSFTVKFDFAKEEK